ncbi:MAG: P-loop NTPase fold protein [Flavobacteriales bacterium]
MADKKHNIDLLSDQAIQSLDQDQFDRRQFVEAIARIIYSQSTEVNPGKVIDFKEVDENMIIGLYGSWGFGKSSILNMLKGVLENDQSLRTVYFNPWMYGSEEQLIISLFQTIVYHTGLKNVDLKNLIELLERYYSLVSMASSATGEMMKSLTKALEPNKKNKSAMECKDEIDKILIGTANPLTIFIDDVDRLSNYESITFKNS